MTTKADGPDKVLMAHGSGGKLSQELFQNLFQPAFANNFLDEAHDGTIFTIGEQKLAFSTDSYVVNPVFFPGGNIGDLAVNGTVNDLAMCGARPLYLSAGFILEEGFKMESLRIIVDSMKQAALKAGIMLVTGDTKVVENGKADAIFINTAGIGVIDHDLQISPRQAKVGDAIILNGRIADHGIAVMSKREGLDFEADIQSDSAPLNELVAIVLKNSQRVHVMRDATRGGVAAVLNEIAESSQKGILIDESKIPIADAVKAASAILGLDPLYIANEGKMVVIVDGRDAEAVLTAMRQHSLGQEAQIIGQVVESHPGRVIMETVIGTRRIVDMPAGEQLPRIC